MKGIFIFRCAFSVLVLMISSCATSKEKNTLTIATAANMHATMEAIAQKFSEKTGIACELVLGSSGKLTAQIQEGAPYDVFVSANMKYPDAIYRRDLAETVPKIYAYGALVLWTLDDSTAPTIDLLTVDSIEHIALANPKTAPYGSAAMEVLRYYDLVEKTKNKLVFGESIAQTNQFIRSGAAEVGFTALSVVLSPELKNRGRWVVINPGAYTPIEQGIVVIKRDLKTNRRAMKFHDFIFSKEARQILKKFGYSVDE